ncbi:hypothetical protein [Bradyrhizobium sp. HKCCYLR20261]|uniref:hypothetical protein n=1 Tax=Bradyrhizobium sp. HKCCYLR20261 TaxID=3420760 RepID=UPI003EC0EC7C
MTGNIKVIRAPNAMAATRKPATLPPITWWRTMSAKRLGSSSVQPLREALKTIAILGEPAWPAAVRGDPSAATGLALRLCSQQSTVAYDLAMTAVAACAAEGSDAACLVMAHMLGRDPGATLHEARLANGWLGRLKRSRREREAAE